MSVEGNSSVSRSALILLNYFPECGNFLSPFLLSLSSVIQLSLFLSLFFSSLTLCSFQEGNIAEIKSVESEVRLPGWEYWL